jgi:hypothetical protein
MYGGVEVYLQAFCIVPGYFNSRNSFDKFGWLQSRSGRCEVDESVLPWLEPWTLGYPVRIALIILSEPFVYALPSVRGSYINSLWSSALQMSSLKVTWTLDPILCKEIR